MKEPTIYEFMVEGHGIFPIDMLRYDRCWPANEQNANRLQNMSKFAATNVSRDPYRIVLKGLRAPSERWLSFGWVVTIPAYR